MCGSRAKVHECGSVAKEVYEEYERDNSKWLGSRVKLGVGGLFLEMSLIGLVESKW